MSRMSVTLLICWRSHNWCRSAEVPSRQDANPIREMRAVSWIVLFFPRLSNAANSVGDYTRLLGAVDSVFTACLFAVFVDVGRPTTAPARKPVSAPTRPLATKPSKPEPPKAAAAAARPDAATKRPAAGARAADAKPSRPKAQNGKLPAMAEVKASPRPAAGPRPGLGKTSTASPRKAVGSSMPLAVKRGSKPTQSVPPLSASGELAKKTQAPRAAAAAVTAAAIAVATVATAAAVVEAEQPPPVEPQQPAAARTEEQVPEQVEASPSPSVPAGVASEAVALPAQQPEALEETAAIVAPLSPPPSPGAPACLPLEPQGPPPASEGAPHSPVTEEQEQEQEQEVEDGRESLVPAAAVVPGSQSAEPEENTSAVAPSSLHPEREEAVEKAEEEIDEEEGEGQREGSQPVSVSDRPTEESRPCSESVWRGGATMSELDSEGGSGSQKEASEPSTSVVLEGTESTDLLGDAGLKTASTISPEVEKLSDIPANEEEEEDEEERRRRTTRTKTRCTTWRWAQSGRSTPIGYDTRGRRRTRTWRWPAKV